MEPFRPTYAEIDLKKLKKNILTIKNYLPPKTKLMAIVKANAYGHGAVEISKAAEDGGADYFGVASLGEALELRSAGIKLPILILSETNNAFLERVIDANLTQTVYTFSQAQALSDIAISKNKQVKIHIKIDTGMSRVGVLPDEAIKLIKRVKLLKNVEIEGLFTHFANADNKDSDFTIRQFSTFMNIVDELKKEGITFSILHAANSAAMLNFPETILDMVRVGICLYGIMPTKNNLNKINSLEPILSFKTKILYIKEVPENTPISYGSTYYTKKLTRIATIPVGYADGLPRKLSNKGQVLIKGKKYPIVGNVTMDMTMIDIGFDKIEIGDEVILIGKDGNNTISAWDIAELDNTIAYEIVCGIGKRVPRIYRN